MRGFLLKAPMSFRAYAQQAQVQIDARLRKAGQAALVEVINDAARNAPVNKDPRVVGGRLKGSYNVDLTQSGNVIGQGGSNLDYAPHQEFGTRYQPGKPHLRPAIGRFEQYLKAALDVT